jgi:hypothetical protein
MSCEGGLQLYTLRLHEQWQACMSGTAHGVAAICSVQLLLCTGALHMFARSWRTCAGACRQQPRAQRRRSCARLARAGSVPMFIRVQDPLLIKELQNLEMLGSVSLAAFARQGVTSASNAAASSSASEDEPQLSDHSVPADELEHVGTLAQMKGMTWSTSDGVETARAYRFQHIVHFCGFPNAAWWLAQTRISCSCC